MSNKYSKLSVNPFNSLFETTGRPFDSIFDSINSVFGSNLNSGISYDEESHDAKITLLVPGHNAKTLDIEITDLELSIKSIEGTFDANVAATIDRKYKLPKNYYDTESISCTCVDGVLTVTIPVSEKPKPKTNKIEIQ